MLLHGLDRQVSDLDVFVSEKTFAEMARNATFVRDRMKTGIERLRVELCPLIEIYKEFQGVTFEAVQRTATVLLRSHGLRVGSLESVLAWKRAAHREKDILDIEMLNRVISTPGDTTG
jgi:hypothetical protein